MKENSFMLAKERRRYPAQTIRDVDFANDIALRANTHAQAESLLNSLEQTAGGVGLHVSAVYIYIYIYIYILIFNPRRKSKG